MAWLTIGLASQIGWWVLIVLIVIVAVIAIVFAVLAFGESQVYKPYRNIVRQDIIAKGDLIVDGDSKIDAVDAESLHVHKSTTLNRLKVSSLRLNDVVSITDTGTTTIQLNGFNSAYLVDSNAGSTLDLVLPPISEVPGQVFQIMKSQDGSNATVNILISTGDFLCDNSGCLPASLNPLITLLPNQADQLWISNDFSNSWKPI
jgi:hypothetical protein